MDPDELSTRLLKELAEELTPVFTLFYQASLDQGTIPEDWKTANVVPIFKKGTETDLRTTDQSPSPHCLQDTEAHCMQ